MLTNVKRSISRKFTDVNERMYTQVARTLVFITHDVQSLEVGCDIGRNAKHRIGRIGVYVYHSRTNGDIGHYFRDFFCINSFHDIFVHRERIDDDYVEKSSPPRASTSSECPQYIRSRVPFKDAAQVSRENCSTRTERRTLLPRKIHGKDQIGHVLSEIFHRERGRRALYQTRRVPLRCTDSPIHSVPYTSCRTVKKGTLTPSP